MSNVKENKQISPIELESLQGDTVLIPDTRNIVHLQFRRYAGCPMCNLHLSSFIQRYAELQAEGIREVVVFHSSKGEMLRHGSEAPFPLIPDPDRVLYKEFGVEPSIKSLLHPKALFAGIRGLVSQGWSLPSRREATLGRPADFLVDSDGAIIAVKYGKHAYDQWSVDEVIEKARS